MSFSEFGLAEPLVRAVAAEGYTRPTPIQAAAIPVAVSGRDVLGLAQTGTGKTAAFALPLLHRLLQKPRSAAGTARPIRALILSPTRELAVQIAQALDVYGRHTGLRSTVVVGGVGMQPQIRALQRGVEILVATPGRLDDLRRQGYIDLRSIELFVLDEADRMLDIGFLPDVQRLTKLLPTDRQTLFFSATMPREVAALADEILRDPVRIEIAPVAATADLITQSVCFVPKPHKSRLLTTILTSQPVTRALVFTRTKHGADRVVEQLERAGIRAAAIHGNKSQAARQRSLAQFRLPKPPVLVATDLAARGLDVDGVSHVLNYDLPVDAETYVHRIGRTGRAGATGVAVSFCDESERKLLRAIEGLLKRRLPTNSTLAAADVPMNDRPREMSPPARSQSGPSFRQSGPSRNGSGKPANRFQRRRYRAKAGHGHNAQKSSAGAR